MYQRIALITLCSFLFSCGNSYQSKFPMEKRFWDAKDYYDVYYEIRYKSKKEERYPEFGNKESAPVLKKILDRQNYKVILEDEQLGLSHRNNVAGDFFKQFQNLSTLYQSKDRQDKYVYGMELVEVYKFGLDLQILYFKLGNDNIIKEADDAQHPEVLEVLRSNENTVFENYTHYLDFVNKEDAFEQDEIQAFCDGIDTAFPKLFDTFPNGNTNIVKGKAKLMLKKSQNKTMQNSLQRLLEKIEDINFTEDPQLSDD